MASENPRIVRDSVHRRDPALDLAPWVRVRRDAELNRGGDPMNPRLASVLATLVLALAILIPTLSTGGPAAAPALCAATGTGAAPLALPASPVVATDSPTWDPFDVTQAAACNQRDCDALCAPLQGRCKAGSCFCLRDPL
jgi:hypothetical protein